MRVGIGYDIHPLVSGRELILGGVKVDFDRGLAGHSDADVLIHALCDAILGALGLGDLGEYFPETEEYRGISSMKILEQVCQMMREEKYRLINADTIIHAERPRLSGYREKMSRRIAESMQVSPDKISIKATRGENMGDVGKGRAISARAVVLLDEINE